MNIINALDVIMDEPIIVLVHLLAVTGMRPKTLFSLDLFSFNREENTIEFVESKTFKYRRVKLTSRQFQEFRNFFHKWGSVNNIYKSVRAIRRASKKYLKSIPALQGHLNQLYQFRYFYIYSLVEQGWTVFEIQKHLGHKEISVTQQYVNTAISIFKNIQKGEFNYG